MSQKDICNVCELSGMQKACQPLSAALKGWGGVLWDIIAHNGSGISMQFDGLWIVHNHSL
jgi:hypothetical protein